MDPEKPVVEVASTQASSVAQNHDQTSSAAPAAQKQDGGFGVATPKSKDNTFSEFNEHSAFNVPVALTWTLAIFSILATMFFWWMNNNLVDSLEEKTAERDTIKQQISSQGEIEKEANDFKLSVNQLKKAYADKYNLSEFFTGFYAKVTKDVALTNLTVSSDGTLTVNGTTTSYRAVADFMTALESFDNLKDIDLTNTSNNVENNKVETVFAITAKIDKTKQSKTEAVTDTSENENSSDSVSLEEGGNNAKI